MWPIWLESEVILWGPEMIRKPKSEGAIRSAFPTQKKQNLKPKMSKRSGQRSTNTAKKTEGQHTQWVDRKTPAPRAGTWRHVTSLASALSGAEKEKNSPSLFLVTDINFIEFWAQIYTTIVAERKHWIFKLVPNLFQPGDTLRHLTEANSNLLWKKILQNGASMNSCTLSYKENKLFFKNH